MAENFLKRTYQYAEVITMFRQVVEHFRVEEAHHAFLLLER